MSFRGGKRYKGEGVGILELIRRSNPGAGLRVCQNGCRIGGTRVARPSRVMAPVDVFINGHPAGSLCDGCAIEAEALWREMSGQPEAVAA